jgi:membrane protease YdiL (CAAX protease family)
MDVGGQEMRMRGRSAGSLVTFFVLTYAVTWICFLTVAFVPIPAYSGGGTILLLLGTFAPSLVSMGITASAGGVAAVKALVAPVTYGQVALRWYVFAAGYFVTLKLAVAALHRLAAGEWPRFGDTPWFVIPFAIALSTPVQAGEEIGWRGFALPRLADRHGLRAASILLGIVWSCWHLPQFFIFEADTYGQSFVVYLLQVTAISVAMAWLYAHTRGSLLLVMLLHAAINNSKDVVPSATSTAGSLFGLHASLVAWLTVALLWVCAAYFLATMPAHLPPRDGASSGQEIL